MSNQQKHIDDVTVEKPVDKVRMIADYQLGRGVGIKLFPDDIEIQLSPRTGRIRYINLNGERLATLRPTDGMLSLSIKAGRFMAENTPFAQCLVTVKSEVAEFIAKGGDVFAVHVLKASDDMRAKDEAIVLDEAGNVLAVGKALLSSLEMMAFKTGVAIKVRHGANKKQK